MARRKGRSAGVLWGPGGLPLGAACLAGLACLAARPAAGPAADWPQWGGGPGRRMASQERGLPSTFDPKLPQTIPTDPAGGPVAWGRNVKWAAPIGYRTNGSPVVTGGRILIGSGLQDCSPDKRNASERGCGRLLCLDEQTGRMLWQLIMPQLPEKVSPHADSGYGVCSTPTVQGDRVYVVSSRGEVLCLDLQGQANGNDGPFRDEGQYATAIDAQATQPTQPTPVKDSDGDILWLYDMVRQLKAHPHDASSSSVLIHGELLYVCTGNGKAGNDKDTPSPLAPSLIVLDKRSGRLVAQDGEKIGTRLLKGQWSSPSLCRLGDRELIIHGGGDGVCYAFQPVQPSSDGQVATPRKVWAVDCNPPEYRARDGEPIPYKRGDREGPAEIIGTPTCWNGRVYVTIGREPAYGTGPGCLTCIDAARGQIIWQDKEVGRTMSTAAIADGRAYVADLAGVLHCLDAETGKVHWRHKVGRTPWGSAHMADGKVFVGTAQGLVIMPAGEETAPVRPVSMGNISATPCSANGVLYVANQKTLYAVCEGGASTAAAPAATARR